MKCINCGKEIESKGNKPKQYCSDKCRKAHNRSIRTEVDVQSGQNNPIRTDINAQNPNPDTLSGQNPEETNKNQVQTDDFDWNQVPEQIRPFPKSPPWKHSIQYKNRIIHLVNTTIEQLETENYDIPNWRYLMENGPVEIPKI